MRLAGTWLQGPAETAVQKTETDAHVVAHLDDFVSHTRHPCFLPTIILAYFPLKGPSDEPRWAPDSAPPAARHLGPRAMTQTPGYGYFMRKETLEQPCAVRDTLAITSLMIPTECVL
jgi:hypothetical protein